MRDALDPVTTLLRLFRNWWKIVIAALLGGLLGLAFSTILPPLYQAEAIFHASLDFTEINFENLVGENGEPVTFTQYDEDLALQVIQRVLLAELPAAFDYARSLDHTLDFPAFEKNHQIQRYHALWYLRYRHPDPQIAQSVVNFWAEKAWQTLQDAQAEEKAETFVIVERVAPAWLPQAPLYQNRNALVLAGTLIGFVIGVMGVDFYYRYATVGTREA